MKTIKKILKKLLFWLLTIVGAVVATAIVIWIKSNKPEELALEINHMEKEKIDDSLLSDLILEKNIKELKQKHAKETWLETLESVRRIAK
jgi:hypothetical protein